MVDAALKSVGENLYREQLVNSERSFQAAMWGALRDQFEKSKKTTFKIFIEPCLTVRGGRDLPPSLRYPDLVVCNRDSVVGVFELKFKPRGRASSTKDLETFELLAKNRKDLIVKNQRYYPKQEMKEYAMSKSVLFGWIAIAKRSEELVSVKGIQDVHLKRFVYETDRDER